MKRPALHRLAAVFIVGLVLATTACASRSAPQAADEAVQKARQAARADRHDDAITWFTQALQASPERRREWLLEIADQHTWAGRLDQAMQLYREAIVALEPAEQPRARVGLARALAWADRHAEALEAYEQALAQDPTNREAQVGHARVLSWRGRHRVAASRMQPYLQTHPHDREATLVLAESLVWMGRPDRAAPVLRQQLGADPQDQRAAGLLGDIERSQRPVSTIDWRDFRQSDDLRIQELALATRLSLADGRGHVGPRYSIATYRPPSGPVERIRVQRPGVQARYRISDALEWHGSVALDLIDTEGAAGDHRRLTHDTYLTWWPNDLLRIDLASARWTFDSEEALRAGLTATQAQASVDITPDDRTRLTGRVNRADHSDGNRRSGSQLEVERLVWRDPRVSLGWRHTRFGFRFSGRGGYYNPDRYRSDEALLQLAGVWRPGFKWGIRLGFGRENEQPGGGRPIRSGSANLAWEARPGVVVETAYDYATSRTLATGGFQRGIGRITLRLRH